MRFSYKTTSYTNFHRESLEEIRRAVQRGQLTGSNRFVEEVFNKIGRRVELRGQGRPKKRKK